MKPVVFLGPSMPKEDALRILDADYRPPVKRGDLTDLEAEIVCIIDGVVMNSAAVGHREIINILENGTKVIGGGSMGALRAAELKDFGMIGVGLICKLYSTGKIEGDDEVVLMYDPYSLKPLSEPLINIRLNLEEAVAEEVIDAEQMDVLMVHMKALYFPQRSYDSLMRYAKSSLDVEAYNRLKEFIETARKDFKENDAKITLFAVKSEIEKSKNLTNVNEEAN